MLTRLATLRQLLNKVYYNRYQARFTFDKSNECWITVNDQNAMARTVGWAWVV